MRALLIVLAVAMPVLAEAQSPQGSPPSRPTLPVRVGDAGVFLLQGGGTLVGTLVALDAAHALVEIDGDQRLDLPRDRVVGRLGPLPWYDGTLAGWRPDALRIASAEGVRYGTLASRENDALLVRGADGQISRLPLDGIEVEFVGEYVHRRRGEADAGRGRHLFVPTAAPLALAECMASTSGFAPAEVTCGTGLGTSVSAGVAIPYVFGAPMPAPATSLDLTVRSPALRAFRAAAGLTLLASRENAVLYLHAELTASTAHSSTTLYAGPPPRASTRVGRFDAVVVAVGHTSRLSPWFSVVAEAWLTPRTSSPDALAGLALRLHKGRLALDLGGLATASGGAAPWLALTFDGTGVGP